jgi:hypothetical protein
VRDEEHPETIEARKEAYLRTLRKQWREREEKEKAELQQKLDDEKAGNEMNLADMECMAKLKFKEEVDFRDRQARAYEKQMGLKAGEKTRNRWLRENVDDGYGYALGGDPFTQGEFEEEKTARELAKERVINESRGKQLHDLKAKKAQEMEEELADGAAMIQQN